MKRIFSYLPAVVFMTAAILLPVQAKEPVPETGMEKDNTKSDIVVMIDPGHGGTNLGAQIPGIDEKNITLLTALAMKEELEKYDGVTVYMTRYDDAELSLQERAEKAAEAGADFLFSIHYNKAVPNRLYGAEVWIPSLGENYAKGYACGDLVLNELCDGYGLYRRGIKTKLNSAGTDYYGIIKNASALGIPSMIIEHCHIDNEVDIPYIVGLDKIQYFGRLDATAVAKYFHLKSKTYGVDYSNVRHTQVVAPTVPIGQDMTPPEQVSVKFLARENGTTKVNITAKDMQSPILYYDYSFDGGATWSPLLKWTWAGNTNTVIIPGTGDSVTVRAYNQYDLCTQSAPVSCNL